MRRVHRVTWLLVPIFFFGFTPPADAAVLCTPKSGQGTVRVREACKKNERQLDSATLGLSSGSAVYDGNGKRVGDVIGSSQAAVNVLLKVEERFLTLGVLREYFTFAGSSTVVQSLVFESSDCSGAPIVRLTPSEWLFPHVVIAPPGSTIYLPDPDATPQQFSYMSELTRFQGCIQRNEPNVQLFISY